MPAPTGRDTVKFYIHQNACKRFPGADSVPAPPLWLLRGGLMRSTIVLVGLIGSLAIYGACSATGGGSQFTGAGGGQPSGNGNGNGSGSGQGGDDLGFDGGANGSGGGMGPGCASGPNDDKDKDGWTVAQGDCNDCDPNVNPGAIEVLGMAMGDGGMPMPADEDCDGTVDNVLPTCDDNLALGDTSPMSGAK